MNNIKNNFEINNNNRIKKTILCDIDGVLNYYPYCWIEFINMMTNSDFKTKDEALNNLGDKKYFSLKEEYRNSDFKANLKAREEAVLLLKYLKDKGYSITIITSRPFSKYPHLHGMTLSWLKKNNFVFDDLIPKSDPLISQFDNVEYVIEDEEEFALQFAKTGYKTFCFNDNASLLSSDDNLIKIKRLDDIKELIK